MATQLACGEMKFGDVPVILCGFGSSKQPYSLLLSGGATLS